MFSKATWMCEVCRTRQLRKFSRLHKATHPETITAQNTVINLSNQNLNEGISSALQKGLNYAVTPRRIPIEDTITGVEKNNTIPTSGISGGSKT
jgi:hypothetical protein